MEDTIAALERLTRGREAFGRHAWRVAYNEFVTANRELALPPEDLERLAIAAGLVGAAADSIEFWTRAHNEFLARGEVSRAVRCSFWLGLVLMLHDEKAQSNGWLARSRRLLDEAALDCVEQGYLLVPAALQTYWGGDTEGGHAHFAQAAAIGERFREPDLLAVARLGMGETLVHLGDSTQGLRLIDEAMASVTSGEVSPMMVGLVYCAVLSCCQQLFDLGRAREWSAAFTRWCESQPDLVPFRGDCLVNQAEVMQLRGAWPSAVEEAQRACERLSEPGARSWAGAAYYRQAEIHRLRGEYGDAEEAFRLSNQWGYTPQPGLALLRLAQGNVTAAAAAISRSLAETLDGLARSRLLPAHVEIALASGDLTAARTAAQELVEVSAGMEAPYLRALSAHASGTVMLAEGDAAEALHYLRNACNTWDALETPFEAARARAQIAEACRRLGDEDGAELEKEAARRVFERLGAAPSLALLDGGQSATPSRRDVLLTERELEVLRLIAAGNTNRAVAEHLVLSDHTVRRHLQNIFAKLGVSTRSAATAYAFQHGLV
jgi:DNA-binding NarL/FixJ family response regulator